MEIKRPTAISSIRKFIVRAIQGAIIGAGAILPGISGGVLCVVFGIYRPMMAVLAHPFQNLKHLLEDVHPDRNRLGCGICRSGGADCAKLLTLNAAVIVSLFIGLIIGTFPSLFREGAKNGKSKAACGLRLSSARWRCLRFSIR